MTGDPAPSGDVVSVIVPAWRAAGTIERALASIAAQTVPPREVVVVDDGSDDGTDRVAQAFQPRMNGIALTVLRQDNLGAGAARNRAIRESSGSLLAFLDADDAWLPDKLARTLPHLADPDIAFAAHDMTVIDGTGHESLSDSARHFRAAADPYAALFRRGFVATSTVVARRAAVDAAGGFDETLRSGQDYELWLHIAGMDGWRFVVFPGALTRYHLQEGSITTVVGRRRQAALTILHRHLGVLHRRVARPLRVAIERGAVIAYEAAMGYLRAGRPVAALFPLLALPLDLARIGCAAIRIRRQPTHEA